MNEKIIEFRKIADSFLAVKAENRKYLEAVMAVENSMVTLHDMQMPPKEDFKKVPETYDQMDACYESMKRICDKFTINLYDQLELYPDSCLRTLVKMNKSLEFSLRQIEYLIQHPHLDQGTLDYKVEMLTDSMNDIIELAGNQITDLAILLKNINSFSENEVSKLNTMMASLLDTIHIENSNYDDVKKELEQLKKELEKEVNINMAELVGIVGATIGILCCGLILCAVVSGGIGIGLTLGVGTFAVGAGLLTIGCKSFELAEKQRELQAKFSELSAYESDIVVLSNWEDSVSSCARQLSSVTKDLTIIKQAWTDVSSGFTYITEEVMKAKGKLNTEQWESIRDILKSCQKTSREMQKMLEGMKLADIKFSYANVPIGVTSIEMKTILERESMVSFKEYMLAI